MFRRQPTAVPSVPVDVTGPHDTCFRCGRPTPLGVSLCKLDNPAHIKAPSATQVHGTIVAGIVGGVAVFALIASIVTGGIGPFEANVTGQASLADGSTEVVIHVTNDGTRPAAASCRLSRGTVSGAGESVFLSEPIPAGESRDFTRVLPPQPGTVAGSTQIVVRCN